MWDRVLFRDARMNSPESLGRGPRLDMPGSTIPLSRPEVQASYMDMAPVARPERDRTRRTDDQGNRRLSGLDGRTTRDGEGGADLAARHTVPVAREPGGEAGVAHVLLDLAAAPTEGPHQRFWVGCRAPAFAHRRHSTEHTAGGAWFCLHLTAQRLDCGDWGIPRRAERGGRRVLPVA